MCVWCLVMLIQRLGSKVFWDFDSDRLVQVLANMLTDASGNGRLFSSSNTPVWNRRVASAARHFRGEGTYHTQHGRPRRTAFLCHNAPASSGLAGKL